MLSEKRRKRNLKLLAGQIAADAKVPAAAEGERLGRSEVPLEVQHHSSRALPGGVVAKQFTPKPSICSWGSTHGRAHYLTVAAQRPK